MQNAILYQAYGGDDFNNECRFSLLKYLQVYNLTPPVHTAIVVYTDKPGAFDEFIPFFKQFEYKSLSKETVQKWKGTMGFVHRLKIEMLIDFLSSFTGNLLYCDTDTYLTEPVETIFNDIDAGNFYMHEYEGLIDKTVNPSFQKWERFLSTTSLTYNDKQVEFSKTLKMFNAGVVGLNSNHKDVLQDVLALTDSVYQKFQKHIAEQFAFSYCFQKAGVVKTADNFIAHYWNLKEFRQLLQIFFTRNAEESIPNLVKKVHHIDAMLMQRQKTTHQQLPFLQRLFKNISGKGWRIEAYEKRL